MTQKTAKDADSMGAQRSALTYCHHGCLSAQTPTESAPIPRTVFELYREAYTALSRDHPDAITAVLVLWSRHLLNDL